jgi:hypothetical protein
MLGFLCVVLTNYFPRLRGGKTPNWSIVEIQGELQNNKAASSFHGKVIGDLHYNLEVISHK